jgi:hypothetical protein
VTVAGERPRTLLRALRDIPEHVPKGDFVLRLSEGVVDPAGTLGQYVLTPELVRCFDQALDCIGDAVRRRTRQATYLHGRFGSGKSHCMAVRHLILSGNPQARGLPEPAGVIAKHNDWLQGKKFLLVPYHMIGGPQHGERRLRRLRRFHPPHPPRGPRPRRLPGGEAVRRRPASAAPDGRRPLLRWPELLQPRQQRDQAGQITPPRVIPNPGFVAFAPSRGPCCGGAVF